MTSVTAVCLALSASDGGGPACLLPFGDKTLLTRLLGQLRDHGTGRIVVLTRPEWTAACTLAVGQEAEVQGHASLAAMLDSIADIADTAPSDLLIVHGEVVTHDGAITNMLLDPRVHSGVLSSSRAMHSLRAPGLRIVRGRVVASESAYHSVHTHNSALLGMCKVGATDLGEAAVAARELAGLTTVDLPDEWSEEFADKVATGGAEVLAATAGTAVLAQQLTVDGQRPRGFPDPAELQARVAAEYRLQVMHPAEGLRDDPLPLLVVGLIRRDVLLTTAYLRELFWDRPMSVACAEAARDELAAIDEDAVQLNSAVKATDGFFTTFFVSTYSRYIARWAARRGLTPNQITTLSMLLGLVAAAAFATGTPAGMLTGAIMLQIAFTADCVDGQLARYSRQFSKLGAWLDSVFDRGKEYAVYAGLAIGATANGADGTIWFLAAAALVLQTFRHYVDFSYAAQQHQALAVSVRHSVKVPDEGDLSAWESAVRDANESGTILQRLGRSGVKTSVAFERQPWRKWLKRIIVLPIGERFALISLTAVIGGPRTTFTWLLAWGAVAALYTTTGRVLRSYA
jgi:phosphatidylglycerophosphate synthase